MASGFPFSSCPFQNISKRKFLIKISPNPFPHQAEKLKYTAKGKLHPVRVLCLQRRPLSNKPRHHHCGFRQLLPLAEAATHIDATIGHTAHVDAVGRGRRTASGNVHVHRQRHGTELTFSTVTSRSALQAALRSQEPRSSGLPTHLTDCRPVSHATAPADAACHADTPLELQATALKKHKG